MFSWLKKMVLCFLTSEISLASLWVDSNLSAFRGIWALVQRTPGLWQVRLCWGPLASRRLAVVDSIILEVFRNEGCCPKCRNSFTWQVLSCLWNVMRIFRGGGRSKTFRFQICFFLTLSSQDPLTVSRSPVGKWKTERHSQYSPLCTYSMQSMALRQRKAVYILSAPEVFIV